MATKLLRLMMRRKSLNPANSAKFPTWGQSFDSHFSLQREEIFSRERKVRIKALTPSGAYISKSELTESSLWIRLIASARRSPIERLLSLGHSCSLSVVGMLLVAITRSSLELLMR